MKQVRRRLTYANVMSTIAVFLALGGATAFAVAQLPSKSVGARQLRSGAVTANKLRKNAVTAPKLKARAVKTGKLANHVVKTSKLANASVTNIKLGAGAVSTDKIGPEAVTGDKVNEATLGQVPSANFANSATFATSANPVAFARVDGEGNVDPSLAKGISSGNVTPGKEAGIYCVTVPGISPRGAQVTPEYDGSGLLKAFVTIGGTGDCPAPQVEVQMWTSSLIKAPFYIVVYY